VWTPSRSARCLSRSARSSSSRASKAGDGPHPPPDADGPARSGARESGGGISRCGVIREALRKLVGDLDACASLATRARVAHATPPSAGPGASRAVRAGREAAAWGSHFQTRKATHGAPVRTGPPSKSVQPTTLPATAISFSSPYFARFAPSRVPEKRGVGSSILPLTTRPDFGDNCRCRGS
jgi:hypothetical protein